LPGAGILPDVVDPLAACQGCGYAYAAYVHPDLAPHVVEGS